MIVSHERRHELLELLRALGPATEDVLVEASRIPRAVVHAALRLLELDGHVDRTVEARWIAV